MSKVPMNYAGVFEMCFFARLQELFDKAQRLCDALPGFFTSDQKFGDSSLRINIFDGQSYKFRQSDAFVGFRKCTANMNNMGGWWVEASGLVDVLGQYNMKPRAMSTSC
ncbi:hypothetical protein F444_11041 [Phytophthora nicotianae P1976]|uniref:Uncharacterized protein n=1 Tax=Phytophthora nicotianae P1976 TaxID=1317066 RepID=A0A081A284_PHYNI|nr:hypothetical protein F444_11041 [Phytophthora nicotianae P1976]